jgi:nitrite reductase/ring-hydroxylating ferredoxin subunit
LSLAYDAYHSARGLAEDAELTHVGRGTPCGEYFRRYWQPVAYEAEVSDLPLRVRIMGEDLVLFRNGRGAYGLVEQRCSHRGASLEYGVISDEGIRCAYHGFHYAPDGTILATGSGAPMANAGKLCHGAYPLHVFHGLIFAYMGPPEKKPPFPMLDLYDDPHISVIPAPERVSDLECNWLQVHENGMDPIHTSWLHVLTTGTQRGFSDAVGIVPVMFWAPTETGMYYVAARRLEEDDRVWFRVNDKFMPNFGIIPPNDDMETERENISKRPYLLNWNLPVDDGNTKRVYLLLNDDRNPLRPSQYQRGFGQINDRPYAQRQREPGDYDAMTGQGRIAIHAYENLTTTDRGVILFRELYRAGIRAVAEDRDPVGVIRDPQAKIRTRTQNTLVRVPRAESPAAEARLLERVGRELAEGDQLHRFPPV